MGGRVRVLFLSTVLMCSMLAGCFGNDDSEERTHRSCRALRCNQWDHPAILYRWLTNANTGVTFSFDYAYTTSDYGLKTFSLDLVMVARSSQLMLQSQQTSMLNIKSWLVHRSTRATDINDYTVNQTVVLRLNKPSNGVENSADPDDMEINTTRMKVLAP